MNKFSIKNQEEKVECLMWISDLYKDVHGFRPRGYNFETWYKKLGYLIDINKPFILICRSGRRTKLVSKMLNYYSDMTIYNAENGINSWLKSNLNTVRP